VARKARVEVEGGLYHVITRGNNRQRIFESTTDYEEFLSLLASQKVRLPFFLYAYCLMPNHVHLLIERQIDSIGRIMHGLLTGYCQSFNRRHQRVGHLLQGRHKAILCQSDRQLAELVRYIHLNPVRANIVSNPEQYKYSAHRAYLGMAPAGIVDVDPVLRHFGVNRKLARDAYRLFVDAGMKPGAKKGSYSDGNVRILESEEFVDAAIHRIGKTGLYHHANARRAGPIDIDRLVAAVEIVCGVSREEFYGGGKNMKAVQAKELLILAGRQLGASLTLLSAVTGLSSGSVSRRHEAARMKLRRNAKITELVSRIIEEYNL
jgi:REP element-mobilizing transposase RayT